MSAPAAEPRSTERTERPRLVFFHARESGRSRRVEGYLSQVLHQHTPTPYLSLLGAPTRPF